MTYVPTLNSNQSGVQTPPQTLFITQNIQDPVVQQNFEILNRSLSSKLQGKEISPSNIVFGPSQSGSTTFSNITTLVTPGQLQVQIVSRGNPVRVKIAPFSYSNLPSYFSLSAGANNLLQGNFGWQRTVSTSGITTTLSTVTISLQAAKDGGGNVLTQLIPLPAFEFDDAIPSGTYTYQFFFQLYNSNQVLTYQNINAVAYELR